MEATITQKILATHSNKKYVEPGEFIKARIDFCLANDITAPLAIKEFKKVYSKRVFDKEKIAIITDHFVPNKDAKSANQCKVLREFVRRYKILHYYELGCGGIEHTLLPELGILKPGGLIIGADSHTCTYGALGLFSTGVGSTDLAAAFITGRCWFRVPESIKFIYKGKLGRWVGGKDLILYTIGKIGVDGAHYKAMEFTGEAIRRLPMDDRFTMCNMAIEAGGKSGIIEPDSITRAYERITSCRAKVMFAREKARYYKSDRRARYAEVFEYDVSKIEPLVACPYLPSNIRPASRLRNVSVDQVVIGSCTNGRISDLRIAAKILKDKKAKSSVRLIVIPATQAVYLQASKEGLIECFIKAGGVISPPTCGPCLGGHMGVLGRNETAIATTNRNFVGRMGHPKSRVYLSNPAVAAASAIKGRIAHPDEVM